MTPHEEVEKQMKELGFYWKDIAGLWFHGTEEAMSLNQAIFLCQTIQDKVGEAERKANDDVTFWFRNLASKIDYYQFSGASDEDTIKGIHQWLDDQDRRLHFSELPRVYSQAELDQAVQEARINELEHAKTHNMIAGNLIHRVDRRINYLKNEGADAQR